MATKKKLLEDLDLVVAWANRDQQECFSLESTAKGKAEVTRNIATIDRLEKAVMRILGARS